MIFLRRRTNKVQIECKRRQRKRRHVNEEGVKLKAKLFADFLAEKNLLLKS